MKTASRPVVDNKIRNQGTKVFWHYVTHLTAHHHTSPAGARTQINSSTLCFRADMHHKIAQPIILDKFHGVQGQDCEPRASLKYLIWGENLKAYFLYKISC